MFGVLLSLIKNFKLSEINEKSWKMLPHIKNVELG